MGKGEGLVWSASREADESVLMQEGSLPRFDVVEVLVRDTGSSGSGGGSSIFWGMRGAITCGAIACWGMPPAP